MTSIVSRRLEKIPFFRLRVVSLGQYLLKQLGLGLKNINSLQIEKEDIGLQDPIYYY